MVPSSLLSQCSLLLVIVVSAWDTLFINALVCVSGADPGFF